MAATTEVIAGAVLFLVIDRWLGSNVALLALLAIGVVVSARLSKRGHATIVLVSTPIALWTLFFVWAMPVAMGMEPCRGFGYLVAYAFLCTAWIGVAEMVTLVRLYQSRERGLRVAAVLNLSCIVPLAYYFYLAFVG